MVKEVDRADLKFALQRTDRHGTTILAVLGTVEYLLPLRSGKLWRWHTSVAL